MWETFARRLPLARRLYWKAREIRPFASTVHRFRRRRILVRLRLDALWYRASVSASIAPDVEIGSGVRVAIAPGTHSVLRVGSRSILGDGLHITLEGGEALIGERVDIRRGSSLLVGGRLELTRRIVVQTGCSLHCADSITVAPLAGIGEYATIIDSTHHYTGPHDWLIDNVRTGPVAIGYNAWIGAKATVARGVRVGDHSIVAANSLVTTDVPDGHLASGVPAEVRRPVRRPWVDG